MSKDEGGEKTEKATPQRMRKLRKEGSLQRSQDLSAWLVIGAVVITLPMVVTSGRAAAQTQLARVDAIATAPDARVAVEMLGDAMASMLGTLAPMLGASVLAAVVAAAAQGGIHVAPKKLKPSFKHFHPKQGFQKVFGAQAWWNGAKAALKAAAIGIVLYTVIQGVVPLLIGSGAHSLPATLDLAVGGAMDLVKIAVIAGFVLAGLDALVVMRRNRKQTRMSKKEIKDEHKQSEGDPHIKGQIRQRQIAMSRNRMMAEVANADVVMVNPTHVAVALRYEPGTGAPRVIAKGRGHIAARIREKAGDAQVPMVQDVPLARALHDSCEVGQEIPAHLYAAVARVLAFVMALKRRGAAAGVHRDPQAEVVAA
ncbi:EscU/YscU/HrcU family type III secretion system export apparatus switch protein [Demequina iriomotensis]|uniref:EscU/YscU/HrcU family type III secretion system export apparatus switch protein n=1 Tax=Demequina iriomotensis TaxID=1536641 RepID=UPI001E48E5AA|nr:EscU/YscU/HrcU family type III secretion system export apparatus switch protein [Demequina iriomotensis]